MRESDIAGNSTIARSQGFSGTETESTAFPTVKSASPNTREVPHEPATTSMLVSATTHWTSQSRSHAHRCTVGSDPSFLHLRDSGIRTRSTQQTGDATTDGAKQMNITKLMTKAGAQRRARHCFKHPFDVVVTSSILLQRCEVRGRRVALVVRVAQWQSLPGWCGRRGWVCGFFFFSNVRCRRAAAFSSMSYSLAK